jgi:hypothetical protein
MVARTNRPGLEQSLARSVRALAGETTPNLGWPPARWRSGELEITADMGAAGFELHVSAFCARRPATPSLILLLKPSAVRVRLVGAGCF